MEFESEQFSMWKLEMENIRRAVMLKTEIQKSFNDSDTA